MSFLLKIVEGPNKGAEIALVEGVAVTLGKSDDCDIILADPTLPEAPLTVEATASGVTLDGSALEPYHVKSVGSTSFAVGPADVAWGDLVWEQRGTGTGNGEEGRGNSEEGTRNREEGREVAGETPAPAEVPAPEPAPRRRHGCLGCLLWLLIILLLLLGAAWFFRGALRPKAEELWERAKAYLPAREATGESLPRDAGDGSECGAPAASPSEVGKLPALAEKYGLSLTNVNGKAALSGNFATRAERLSAAAAVYADQPGAELDFTDDESFRTAASDSLFTLTEGALKVTAATNRVLSIAGVSPSPAALTKTLRALNDDIPRLRNVDVTGVKIGNPVLSRNLGDDAGGSSEVGGVSGQSGRRSAKRQKARPVIPVCGILTTPYPCLVLQNGQRVLEGATVGDSIILKITADSVTVTNASGRFTWKP